MPRIVAVMVLYGVPHLAEKAVNSVLDTCSNSTEIELICIDNNSPQPLPEAVAERTTYIKTFHNLGYPKGANLGIQIALETLDPDFIMLMNPDIQVHMQGWDTHMLHPIRIGAADAVGFHHIRPRKEGYPSFEVLPKHSYLGGYMLLGIADLWREDHVGLYDPVFGMGYYEDRDWCYRAQETGHNLARVSGLDIDHLHNSSFRAAGTPPEPLVAKNHQIFVQKWKDVRLTEHIGREHDW